VERFRTYRFWFFVDGLDEYKGDSVNYIVLAKTIKEMANCEDVKVVWLCSTVHGISGYL